MRKVDLMFKAIGADSVLSRLPRQVDAITVSGLYSVKIARFSRLLFIPVWVGLGEFCETVL